MACLRWAENPRDALAGFRVAQLLPGVGPQTAERACAAVAAAGFALARGLEAFAPSVPGNRETDWAGLVALFQQLCAPETPWPAQLGLVRRWYEPHLERLYDDARVRLGDLEQLEQLAGAAESRERFLSDLTLDPPAATGAEAGPPHLDEDYLILSTIHSAKGQEWDSVFVLSVADGNLPSDLATGQPEQIEEERRLLYVAMTRAKNSLTLVHPLRFLHPPAGAQRRPACLRAAHPVHSRKPARSVRTLVAHAGQSQQRSGADAGGAAGGRGRAAARHVAIMSALTSATMSALIGPMRRSCSRRPMI